MKRVDEEDTSSALFKVNKTYVFCPKTPEFVSHVACEREINNNDLHEVVDSLFHSGLLKILGHSQEQPQCLEKDVD